MTRNFVCAEGLSTVFTYLKFKSFRVLHNPKIAVRGLIRLNLTHRMGHARPAAGYSLLDRLRYMCPWDPADSANVHGDGHISRAQRQPPP